MTKQERIILIAAGIVLVVVVVAGLFAVGSKERSFIVPSPMPPLSRGDSDKISCEQAGGRWNECGSACRGAGPETACIQVCVPMCECQNTTQCPSDFFCQDFVDGVGVCGAKN